jgi:hypothetical protein
VIADFGVAKMKAVEGTDVKGRCAGTISRRKADGSLRSLRLGNPVSC